MAGYLLVRIHLRTNPPIVCSGLVQADNSMRTTKYSREPQYHTMNNTLHSTCTILSTRELGCSMTFGPCRRPNWLLPWRKCRSSVQFFCNLILKPIIKHTNWQSYSLAVQGAISPLQTPDLSYSPQHDYENNMFLPQRRANYNQSMAIKYRPIAQRQQARTHQLSEARN